MSFHTPKLNFLPASIIALPNTHQGGKPFLPHAHTAPQGLSSVSFIDENHKNDPKYKEVREGHLEMRAFGACKELGEQGWCLLKARAGQLGRL